MALVSDRAICLRRHEYSETSQIIVLLTQKHGLLRALAKGAHRTTKAGASRFDGGIDLLDEGQAVFTDRLDKDLHTLTEWKLFDGHLSLRKSGRAICLGMYLAELTASLLHEHDPHDGLFERFSATISDLSDGPMKSIETAALAFVLDLLRFVGFLPRLRKCAVCSTPIEGVRSLAVSPNAGGVVCANCAGAIADKRNVDARLISIAVNLLVMPRENARPVRPPVLTRAQTDPLHAMLIAHVQAILQKRLRTADYVVGGRAMD